MSSPPSTRAPSGDLADVLARMSVASPGVDNAAVSAPPPPSAAVSLNGEFASVSQGGGMVTNDKTGVPIVRITSTMLKSLCCGHVGQTKTKFCLKSDNECPVGTHVTSKFEVKPDHYYVCTNQNRNSAWTSVCVPVSKLDAVHPDLSSAFMDLHQWKATFDSVKNCNPGEDFSTLKKEIHLKVDPVKANELATPAKLKAVKREGKTVNVAEYVTRELDELKLNLDMDEEDEWIQPGDGRFASHMNTISNSMKAVLLSVLNESPVLSMGDEISSDIEGLSHGLTGLRMMMGSPVGNEYTSIWNGVKELASRVKGLEQKDFETQISSFNAKLVKLASEGQLQEELWKKFASVWAPFIQTTSSDLSRLKVKFENYISTNPIAHGSQGLTSSAQTQSSVKFSIPNPVNTAPQAQPVSNTTVNKEIADLKQQIKSLEGQVQSLNNVHTNQSSSMQQSASLGFNGVTYNDLFFPNPEAVEVWLRAHLTHPSHGLFVDIVSFSEFFGNDKYIERNSTLNEIYLSTKIGYGTLADSTVAASFQNILPGAYGRSGTSSSSSTSSDNQDLTAQKELPGLPTFKKWDGLDGRTGRRYWIREEGRKTRHQIDGWIRDHLSGKAQILAQDLLVDSFTMSETLYSFISSSYEDTMHSGRFESEQAWALTCSFVKRIFTEIGYARVVARDGINVNNPWRTAGIFVFATLKAHVIMNEFMRLSIRDHPSISSEMVKFVCYTQPAANTTELVTRLSAVENLQRSDQSNVSKHDSRLKKIETWKSDLDKLLKRLKEKAGI